jgi:hypothetical protein
MAELITYLTENQSDMTSCYLPDIEPVRYDLKYYLYINYLTYNQSEMTFVITYLT